MRWKVNCCLKMRTKYTLSLRASAQDFRGNPPVGRNQVTISTTNRNVSHVAGQLSIHFLSNRGIATEAGALVRNDR